jgi:transposase
VIDVMTRLKIHNMAEGGTPQASIAKLCGTSLRSVERILAETPPTRDEVLADERIGAKRRGRPPKADAPMIERIRLLLETPGNDRLPATEVLRRAAEWGYTGGRSQMTELVKRLRPKPRQEPIVRFEGLPGEYTQFDFGECEVAFTATGKQRVQFFAARLKYSRFMHVILVPDQTAETLVRSLIACLVAFGGSTKEWVFDNPRTVRISPIGVKPVVLHRFLRQLVAEYNVIATLCAPRSGNQKGSVERVVGYVKNSFLRVRKFRDLADLEAQLAEWLHEVNHVRPSDATGVIPAIARQEEARWLAERPVQVGPEAWAIEDSATVTPMGTISYRGTAYSATARHLGAPATLLVRQRTLEIVVAGQRCTHVREDHTGEVRRLPEHRLDVLAALHGARKLATFRRQCLLELGQPAWQFMGPLVHRCPHGRWEKPCHELFDLMMEHGDGAMRDAFTRCVARETFTVAAVRAVLREAA